MKRFYPLPVFCSLLLALSGCALHRPTEVAPPDAIPASFVELQQQDAGEVASGRWWLRFDDGELNRMMASLFADNLQIEQVMARLQQAESTLTTTRSARWPSFSLEGQASKFEEPSAFGDVDGDSYSLNGAAAFELDIWGKLASRAKAAGKAFSASREELQSLYLTLSANLAELYYLAVEQRAQLALTEETVDSYRQTVETVEERYRLGLVPAVDLYPARQSLSGAEANQHLYAGNLATTEHALAVLLGHYPDRSFGGELAVIPPTPELFPVGLPSDLINRRPDLRSSLHLVEAADASVAAAIADRFPSINLIGRYGSSRQDLSTGLIEGDFWRLLGNLTMPLIDAGRRRAEVSKSRAVVRERVAAYQQAVLEAFQEVEDALADNRETEQRIASLVRMEEATGSTLRLALDRYNLGVTDYLPVLTAQRGHFEARSRLLTARRQLLSARISLARALGGEWMMEEIEQRNAKQDN